jgi:hypothetical protein
VRYHSCAVVQVVLGLTQCLTTGNRFCIMLRMICVMLQAAAVPVYLVYSERFVTKTCHTLMLLLLTGTFTRCIFRRYITTTAVCDTAAVPAHSGY